MARKVMLAGLILAIAATTAMADMSVIHAHDHMCEHDTDEMQEVLYGPIVDHSTGLRKAFHPAHKPLSPQRYRFSPQSDPMLDSEVSATQRRSFQPSSAQPMRVVVSTADLDDPTKYCENAVETNPDFKGGTVQCTTDSILTAEKKAIYLNKVIPAVTQIFSTFLNVNRVSGNLVVGYSCPSPFTTPASHKTTGVPDADFVLYAAAGPTVGSNVAFAGYCSLDSNNRPVTGRMNFGPQFLVWNDTDTIGQRKLIHTVVHEILHAMGFSGSYINSYFAANTLKTETRRSHTVSYISSTQAVAKAKEFFNCPSLTGPEIEDEGGSGTAGSHWERRTHYDDLMAGYTGPAMYISGVTLGLLEDSGHYFPDWTKVENPQWMRGAGCGVHNELCNTTGGGQGVHFCLTPSEALCTADHSAYGYCGVGTYSGAIPSYNQYYPSNPQQGGSSPIMNYCPIARGYSNRVCNDPVNSDPNSTNYYYARDGRCFVNSGNPRCYRSRCTNGTVIEFQFANDIDGTWHTCPSTGAVVSNVVCPNATVFCTPDLYYSLTPTTTATTPTTTTSTTPTTTTSTTPTTTTSTTPTTTTSTTPTTTTTTTTGTTSTTSAVMQATGTATTTTTTLEEPDASSAQSFVGVAMSTFLALAFLLY